MNLREKIFALPPEAFSGNGICLKPITTEEELACALFDLKLAPEQQELVNPAGFSIGRAYLHPEDNVPCLIYRKDPSGFLPVGFLMLCRFLGTVEFCTSWSYFVDSRYQGQGLGKRAAWQAIRILTMAEPNREIRLSTEQGNQKAQKLYKSLGFVDTGMLDGDDPVFSYALGNG